MLTLLMLYTFLLPQSRVAEVEAYMRFLAERPAAQADTLDPDPEWYVWEFYGFKLSMVGHAHMHLEEDMP